MRQRLADLEEQKNRFLRHMSHELKTPLTALREGAELLSDEVVGKLAPEQREIAEILRHNSIELQKLIEDLLNYGASQFHKPALDITPVDLKRVTHRVLDDHKLALRAKDLKLDVKVQDLKLSADFEKLRVMLDNLVSNAIKFSPAGATISVDGAVAVGRSRDGRGGSGPGHRRRRARARLRAVLPRPVRRRCPRQRHRHRAFRRARIRADARRQRRAVVGDGPGTRIRVRLPLVAAPAPRTTGRTQGCLRERDDEIGAARLLGVGGARARRLRRGRRARPPANLDAEPARRRRKPEPWRACRRLSPVRRVSEVEALVAEFQRLRRLAPSEVAREQEAARQVFNQSRSDAARVRLAMTLALPGGPANEESRALELLDPLVRNPGSALYGLALLMASYIQEQRRLGGQVQALQQNMHGLQQKLDALKTLERSLSERGEGAPRPKMIATP